MSGFMQKTLLLTREIYSFWTSKISDKRILLMESGNLRIVLGLSSFKSDLQQNRIRNSRLRQGMELSEKNLQKGRCLPIQSVTRNVE